MDIYNDDFVLAYDWTALGDVLRLSPSSVSAGKTKMVFGTGIGTPKNYLYDFTIENTVNSFDNPSIAGMTVQEGNIGIKLDLTAGYNNTIFGTANYSGGAVGMRSNQHLIFGTNNLERVRITDAGDVRVTNDLGIGSATNPLAKLDVQDGDMFLRGATGTRRFTIFSAYDIDSGNKAYLERTTDQTNFYSRNLLNITTGNNGNIAMMPGGTGNVGIGTTNPTSKFEVYGAGQATAALADAGVRTDMLALNASGTDAGVGGAILFGNSQSVTAGSIGGAAIKYLLTSGSSNTTGNLAFSTRNAVSDTALTERVRIQSNGNVGIGTTNPSYLLSLDGQAVRTFGTERNTTSNTAGNSLTIKVGGATSGATDKNGGNLIIASGISTGTGSSNIYFQTSGPGTTGTADNALTSKMVILGNGNMAFGTNSLWYDASFVFADTHHVGGTVGNYNLLSTYVSAGGPTGSGSNVRQDIFGVRDSTGTDWMTYRIHDSLGIDSAFNVPGTSTKVWWERDPNHNIQSWGNAADTYMTIKSGKIGIGTTNPDTTLKVVGSICASATDVACFGTTAGNIYAANFIVDGTTHLPDYVFEDDYPLLTIAELENYIAQNKHLPNVPSASDVNRDGLNLSQMVPAILEKTEENTLYIIDNAKNISGLASEASKLAENQNKIVNQLSNKLADQSLSVNEKITLIGANLEALSQEQTETIKNQFTGHNTRLTDLETQMADMKSAMYVERYDELWEFYLLFKPESLKNLVYAEDGNISLLDGKITAADIEALNTVKAKDLEATNSVKGDVFEMSEESSGKGTIPAGETEIEIETPYANENAKISITPRGDSFERILFYDEVKNGESFKVKIKKATEEGDINFDWLIIK